MTPIIIIAVTTYKDVFVLLPVAGNSRVALTIGVVVVVEGTVVVGLEEELTVNVYARDVVRPFWP